MNKIKKWLRDILGINEILEEQLKQTKVLRDILEELKVGNNLVRAYNNAYNIR